MKNNNQKNNNQMTSTHKAQQSRKEDCTINFKVGPVTAKYTGSDPKGDTDVFFKTVRKHSVRIGLGFLVGSFIYLGFKFVGKRRCQINEIRENSLIKMQEDTNATNNGIRKSNADAENAKAIHSSQTDDDIRAMRARSEVEIQTYIAKKECDKRLKDPSIDDRMSIKIQEQKTWEESFKASHKFPEMPGHLRPIFAGLPIGYETPMLLHLLSMHGALCFSRVRAEYLDGTTAAPNLHVMVSGKAGSGKGKFKTVFDCLFGPLLHSERIKYQTHDERKTIEQLIGYDITEARLVELLANNQGAHLYIFSSEVSDMRYRLRKQGGLTYTDIRKSLDNEYVSHSTREKGGTQGMYPIYLNSTLTGTPEEIKKFFQGEIESGTAQRFCFTSIPELGVELSSKLVLPGEDAMNAIRQQIDEYRAQYCYTVGGCSGDETVCDETLVDLDYLLQPLRLWLERQGRMAENEADPYLKETRISIKNRRACIAFHCGIVLHMLWGQPEDETTRQRVIDTVLYLADYITESYLYTVSMMERGYYMCAPCTNDGKRANDECGSKRRQFTEDEIAEMARLHRIVNEKGQHVYGWDTLANKYHTSFSTIKRKVQEYERNHSNQQ